MSANTALELEDVVFRYQEKGKRNILDHTSLSIPAGTLTVLMGGSGCGKSTLAAVAAGLYPENGGFLEGGTIRLYGQDLKMLDPQKRAAYLTVLFQNPDLQFCMNTLREEMRFCLENIRVPAGEMDARIDRAAAELGIAPLLDRTLSTLSGGEKQKAALSCLYVMESRCILLDESFANLDHEAAAQLLEMLLRMKTSGRTILAIDHKADLWLEAADEIILLEEGGKVAARGINCKNLPEHRTDFERLGLFYPGSRPERAARPVAEGKPLLRLRGVSIRKGLPTRRKWGRTVYDAPFLVQNADADFPAGCMTAVLGPSGTGKTTTLRIIGGFEYPDSGDVIFMGDKINDVPPHKRHVNTVFQKYALFPHLNVFENVAFPLRERKVPKKEIKEKVDKMLSMVLLSGFAQRKVTSLSGGQQQRVAIARALVNEPKVLLLDEPLGALDLKLRKDMQQELKKIQKNTGITFIFVTHDQEEALSMSDTIVVMSHGKIQQIGSPTDIYNEPVNAFVADFIGESNIVDGIMKEDFKVSFGGQVFECLDSGFGKDEPVDVVIRPEDVDIVPPEKGRLKGKVTSVTFTTKPLSTLTASNG